MPTTHQHEIDAFAVRLGGAVFAMHRHLPFFAMLLEACSLHLDTEGRVPTACVDDRRRITFGAEFAGTLTDLQLIFVLAHEVCHVAFGHFVRRGARDPLGWNIAGDLAINQLLLDCLGSRRALPEGVLLDESMADLGTEQIYERIEYTVVEVPGGTGPVARDMDYEGVRSGAEVRSPRMPIDDSADAEEEWRRRIAEAAAHAKLRGHLPAALERFVTEHIRPKVDWAAQLRQFLRFELSRDGRDHYSFVPCNRRHVHAGLYLPSLLGTVPPRIAFAIDTSGSMGEDALGQAHAEIDAIRRQFSCGVYLLECDAEVAAGRWVGPHDPLPMPQGGGGTDFRPVFAHLAAERIAVDLVVYLTDGGGEFGPDPGIPTIWVMTSSLRPPWGEFVQVGVDA
jgi:predicted metal-dependent peptidase